MTAVDLDELAALDPDLAARVRAHLDVEAAVAAEQPADEQVHSDEQAKADERYRAAAVRNRERRHARGAERDAEAAGSWDDFWDETERAERAERPTTVIRGVTVPIPHDLPLRFERRAEQLKGSGREEDVRELVGMVFGEGILDAWVDNGMGADEFKTVLLWGMALGRGQPMTFAQAREAVLTQGKSLLPNREARREFERSGGQSRPTSGASTGSTRPALPR